MNSDFAKKLKDVLDSGKVELMISEDVLVDDGTSKICLIPGNKMYLSPRTFGFSFQDGGGFTSVIMTVDCWEKMKAKVDAYVKTLPEVN